MFLISSPDPQSQQHPIPLLNNFPLTAVQEPNPNSVILFLSPTNELNSTQSHYSTRSFSLQSKDTIQIQRFLFLSPTNKSSTPNPIIQHVPSHCRPRTQPELTVFIFPRPVSQQQPIPLLNTLLLTAVRGPTPNSVFFYVFPRIKKSTAPNPIIQHLRPHRSPMTQYQNNLQIFELLITNQRATVSLKAKLYF